MNKELRKSGRPPRTDFSPNPFTEVDNTGPDDEPPAFVPKAVLGGVEREGGNIIGVGRIAHEASGGVSVQADHEEKRKVMGVPEGLEALCANLVMGSGIHQEHDEEHEMARNTARLRIVDLESKLRPDLCI